MKFLFSFLFLIQFIFISFGNENYTSTVDQGLYLKVLPDSLSARIIEISSFADSLSSRKVKKYLFKLDSLAISQNTSGNINVAVYAWQRLYEWNNLTGNTNLKNTAINNIYSAWLSGGLEKTIEKEWTDKLMLLFNESGDFEKLYNLTTRKNEEDKLLASKAVYTLEANLESLNAKLASSFTNNDASEKSNQNLRKYLFFGAVGFGGLLLLFLIILIIQKSKYRKRAKAFSKTEVQSAEKEILTVKLTTSEREKEQLKKVASIGIDKLNEMDSTINNALTLLMRTTDELEMTIQESTNITETSRSELPVALYMSQKNLLHRMGNQVVEDLKTCSSILKKSVK